MLIGMVCLIVGIACIAGTFYIQKIEDQRRVPGFYTTAVIADIKPNHKNGKTAVTFEFTKDFTNRKQTDYYPNEEAENWVTGRRSLIVFDEDAGKVYYNPMKKSRNVQALMMGIGFLILLYGVYWSIFISKL